MLAAAGLRKRVPVESGVHEPLWSRGKLLEAEITTPRSATRAAIKLH